MMLLALGKLFLDFESLRSVILAVVAEVRLIIAAAEIEFRDA
jgi:hypothetical protein